MSVEHPALEHDELVGGLANFRDVAPAGSAMARWARPGVLWRSDAPHPGDAAPSATRGDTSWPPRVVVDLRDPTEVGPERHPLAGPGTEVVALPLNGSLTPAEQLEVQQGGVTLVELYRRLLGTAASWLPELVRTVARADGPTLIHCAAGKDRTGVSVALLLALAGVPRSEIVADYLATREALPRLRPRLAFDAEKVARLAHLLDVSTSAIDAVLDEVAPDPAGFCRGLGVRSDDIARWRRRIGPTGREGRPARSRPPADLTS